LYSWGEGWLFEQKNISSCLIPIADLIVAAPLSLITSFGIGTRKSWGIPLGLVTSGVYIFGSVLVYIQLIWNGLPYPLHLAIPPLFGITISIYFIVLAIKSNKPSTQLEL
jgi:hypothetical protein